MVNSAAIGPMFEEWRSKSSWGSNAAPVEPQKIRFARLRVPGRVDRFGRRRSGPSEPPGSISRRNIFAKVESVDRKGEARVGPNPQNSLIFQCFSPCSDTVKRFNTPKSQDRTAQTKPTRKHQLHYGKSTLQIPNRRRHRRESQHLQEASRRDSRLRCPARLQECQEYFHPAGPGQTGPRQ